MTSNANPTAQKTYQICWQPWYKGQAEAACLNDYTTISANTAREAEDALIDREKAKDPGLLTCKITFTEQIGGLKLL